VSDAQTLPLLVEIGCEEIPARFLDDARDAFSKALLASLAESGLLPPSPTPAERYSTPRRLVVWVPEVLATQPDRTEEILGPPASVGLDGEGKPTSAAQKFAEKNGARADDLVRVKKEKGEYLALKRTIRGRPAEELLPATLTGVITGLSFPKSMYWVEKSGPRFVRPIRWLLAIVGEDNQARPIPFEIAGVKAGDKTYGHRTAGKQAISVQGFKDYAKKLRLAQVEFDPAQRRVWMAYEIKVLLEDLSLAAVPDKELEDWYVNSTEWPKPILGNFDERYLRLPREILITVMRDHQKYFAVEDGKGSLQPLFVTVLNRDDDPKGLIRQGHERVLAARFNDAEFFWEADQRLPLRERGASLAGVTYQAELGSYADKVERMRAIAGELCQLLESAGKLAPPDGERVLRAVELCKCDLTTQMVREFPELQGVVGGLYAAAQGEPQEVQQAIYDHYLPLGSDDRPPRTLHGAVVSLADKIDDVVAGFAVGHEPTGSSDPFALRRQGNGVIKVIVEDSLPIALRPVVEQGMNVLKIEWRKPQVEVFNAILEFFKDRLRYYLESVRKLRYDTVRAVLAAGWEPPVDAARRAEALEKIRGSEDLEALSAAAKRIKNILAKSATASDWTPGEVNASLLEAGPERELFQEYERVAAQAGEFAQAADYGKALEVIAGLRPVVDLFFDKVLVMAEDRAVRENRLRLLGKLDGLFCGLARFSEIASGPADVDAST
jgi:glycyl-tRNA synthetase beta chain